MDTKSKSVKICYCSIFCQMKNLIFGKCEKSRNNITTFGLLSSFCCFFGFHLFYLASVATRIIIFFSPIVLKLIIIVRQRWFIARIIIRSENKSLFIAVFWTVVWLGEKNSINSRYNERINGNFFCLRRQN